MNFTSTTEIDNHADTCCFGANFTPLFFTGHVCQVQPFIDTYQSIENVEICTTATAYDDVKTGLTYILIFNQGLWFGQRLQHSLINPNQCRAAGIDLCDDPFDPFRSLSIHDPVTDTTLPLEMNGTICQFTTRVPSNDELEYCPRIILTSDLPWDPSQPMLPSLTRDRGLKANQVSQVNSFHPVYNDCESDLALSRISAALTTRTLLPALMTNIRYTGEESSSNANVISSVNSRARHADISPEALAEKWKIGLQTAKDTLKVTTQNGIRHALHPLKRRYRTDNMSLGYRRLNIRFYTDTLFAKVKSIKGNTCAQVFATNDIGFVRVHPMASKAQAGEALRGLSEDVGVPNEIVCDGAAEQVGPKSDFYKTVNYLRTRIKRTEPYSPWQNNAESAIRELKKRWKHRMATKKIPRRLWDYGLVYESEIMSRTARGDDRRTGIERITGDTPDISEWLDFDFYDPVWFWDHPDGQDNPCIGRWLGVAHRVGSDMCYWILKSNGNVLARTTVQHIPELELRKDDIREKLQRYDDEVEGRLRDTNFLLPNVEGMYLEDIESDDDDLVAGSGDENSPYTTPEQDDYTPDTYDQYLGAELLLPHGDNMVAGRVTKRARGQDGNPIGIRHQNPLLDTREYMVEFSDGSTAEYTANVIAENMFSQVDSEGRQYMLLKEIVDHRKNASAVPITDGVIISKNGNRIPKQTTKGWEILVEWKDETTDWIPLKDLKASNPVELAEYAFANKLLDEPVFAWWAKDVLRRRNRIISKVKSRYWKTSHKFGFKLPHSVDEALRIDDETGTDYWRKAIEKEMSKVRVAFERWDDGTLEDARSGKKLVGYQEIGCHMIFDIKMDGEFTRKARLVAGGHTTETPTSITYSSVVSRESVRIAFLVAALNDLDIFAADIGNAYLNAPCREKIWTVAGAEFGTDQGAVMIVKRALYGLKSSGASWRAMLAQTLIDLGYQSSKADPDVWIRPQTKPNGFEYYEMVLVYVDDILHLSHNTKPTIDALGKLYVLRADACGEPKRYLGANVGKYQLQDGREVWSMSSNDYVKNAVKNLEDTLASENTKLRGKANRPLPSDYRPEIDVSPLLSDTLANRYQNLIGVLRWACELGRIDILLEVSWLSSFAAMPRRGHLEAVYHVFAYLKKHDRSTLVFDDSYPPVNELAFTHVDWTDFYPEAAEPIPPNMPQPRGNPVKVFSFVDADHAGNLLTRRSHTGILIFLNNSPVSWYSKRQNTVESSTFASELIALRIAVEQIEALRYKLRMFGIPIDGPADIFCDNQSVVKATSTPSSTLSKKHNAICYHKVRESAAAGTIRVAKEDTLTNLADLFTKALPTDRRKFLLQSILY